MVRLNNEVNVTINPTFKTRLPGSRNRIALGMRRSATVDVVKTTRTKISMRCALLNLIPGSLVLVSCSEDTNKFCDESAGTRTCNQERFTSLGKQQASILSITRSSHPVS